MPKATVKKKTARKSGAGRPVRIDAEHRLELRRRKASTSVRISDQDLALFEKLATQWGLTLPETFNRIVMAAATRSRVVVAQDPSADLGWS